MRTETQLQDFVERGRAGQGAVDALVPQGRRATAAIASLDAMSLDDMRCLSDSDLRRLNSRCRDWLALVEFEQGTRDGRRVQMAMLPNDYHPGPRCGCGECQRSYPGC